MEYDRLINNYLAGPQMLRQAVAGMAQEQLDARPVPGKWSTREVVCHIADYEPVYADRMKRVIAENEPVICGGNPDALAARLAYGSRDVDELLPAGDKPLVQAYIDKYVWLAKLCLPQLAAGTEHWWLTPMPFFGGLARERIWIVWRRVLHTCHHRTQVQTWLRLAGQHVPAIYGPSGDV